MNSDIDALKAIKEKENKVEEEIRDYSTKQEEQLEQKKKEIAATLEKARKEQQAGYDRALEKIREEVAVRAKKIVDDAMKEAEGMKLTVTKKELESIVNRLILSYLEE